MARPKNKKTDEEVPTFEVAVHRLGAIVEQLESGDLPLEESLKLFEEGVSLSKRSQAILDEAEQRVEKLLGISTSGEPVTEELDADGD